MKTPGKGFWEDDIAEGLRIMEAEARQAEQQRHREQQAAAAFERMGPLTRSIAETLAAGQRDPNRDNKPRLQQLRNSLDQAADTYARGRVRER